MCHILEQNLRNELSLDTDDKQEGSASLQAVGSGTVNVMNSIRYNGSGNTSNVSTSYNELHL
ncbi:MAG: hypothetical protein GY847_16280 [Proteobacteria bacterium]|nr:hypothetical protein [Pseudomonadota bacterium]